MTVMQNPGAVIVLCFGARPLKGPDPVNQHLATIGDEIADRFNIPALMQKENAARSHAQLCFALPGVIDRADTREALVAAKNYCNDHSIENIALVVGWTHRFRAVRCARTLGLRVVMVRAIDGMYDKDSTQWWTHSLWQNIPRETGACLYYALRGWI